MGRRALAAVAILALATAAGASATAGPSTAGPAPAADAAKKRSKAMKKRTRAARRARLKAFRSCGQLARYGRRYKRRGEGAGPGAPVGLPMPRPDGVERGGELGGAPAPVADQQDSGTNVQEAHVGEPDIVKARGGRIFAVAGNRLHALDASGAAPVLRGSLAVEGYGHQLLMRRDRLLVFSQNYGGYGDQPVPQARSSQIAPDIAPTGPSTVILTEVDVGDLGAMRIVKTEKVPGIFVSARLKGRTIRAVISAPPPALYEPGAGWMPKRTVENERTGATKTRKLAPCRAVRRPVTFFSGLDMVTVLTIDLSKGLPAVDSDAVMSGGEIVYGSANSLYVATQRWTPEPDSADQRPPRTFTAIHKFDASTPGETGYRGSGKVPGYLLNQFSLSEHEGVLRAASTATPEWWTGGERDESQSFVTTLDERSGALVQLGQVGGLGRGERIFAVRFLGDAGYVVTFRQVDPLYTLDLGKPADPRVVGELKLLGYSAYLHPIDDGLLLGIGQDATDQGRLLGTQLQLFDVSDLGKPKRLSRHELGQGSYTEVEYDHHAFLWWGPSKLAVLPVTSEGFSGAVGLSVARQAGIDETGRASHPESNTIRRSFVVGGRLYTMSEAGVEQNALTTLAEEAFVPFPAQQP